MLSIFDFSKISLQEIFEISSFTGTLFMALCHKGLKSVPVKGLFTLFVQKLQATFAKNFASEIFSLSKIIFDFENFFRKNFRKNFCARENCAKSVPAKGVARAEIIFVKKLYT